MEYLKNIRRNIGFGTVLSLLFCLTNLAVYAESDRSSRGLLPQDRHFNLSQKREYPLISSPILSAAFQSEPSKSKTNQGPKKRLGRAVLENAVVFAYSQTKYWVTYEEWLEDWQYDLTWEDQSRRFFTLDAWRFDSNCFGLNWSHALAGGLYYNIARTNNLSRLGSLLFTVGCSFYWEYIVEWRNVISISDNIFTIVGGLPIGEAWYELGKYFNNKTDLGSRILSFINPILKLNTWFDRKEIAGQPKEPEPGWKKFNLFLGGRFDNTPKDANYHGYVNGGFSTQLIHIPDFGEPGKISRQESETVFSEISLDLTTGQRGTEEINVFTRAVYFGHFKQDINEQNKGYSYYFGLGSAFTYFKKRSTAFYDGCEVKVKRGYDLHLEEPREFTDKFSIVHLAGPVFDLTSFSPHLRFRLVLDAYLDFALVNAFALNKYSEGRDISGIKTNLLYYGYYYALGTTFSSDMNVRLNHFELRGLLRYHTWGSLDGRDRFQIELTDDFHVKDHRFQFRFEMGYWIPGTPLELLSSFEGVQRCGHIKDTVHKEAETRLFLGLNFSF